MSGTSGDLVRRGGAAGAIFVAVVAAGDLALRPLLIMHVGTVVPVVVAVLALWGARRSGWRTPAPASLLVLVVVLLGSAPLALERAPDPGVARAEVQGLIAGAAVALTFVALVRGDATRQARSRRGWIAALVLSLLVVVYELVTDRHLFIGPGLSWAESSRTIVAGAFRNPNDFAAALTAMISATLAASDAGGRARRSTGSPDEVAEPRTGPRERRGPWRPPRGLLPTGLVLLGVVAVLLTESRSGVLALAAVLVVHSWSFARIRTGAARPSRLVLGSAAGLVVAAVLAAFLVPVLARHNPVLTLLRSLDDPGTARSDRLRLDLLRAGLRYFDASDGLGTGAGSFEVLLARDPHPGVSTLTWLHDSFLEILLQYGAPSGAALLVVALVVLGTAVRSLRRRPDAVAVALRAELLGAGIAYLALGTASATVVTTPVWWLLLGQCVSCAWAMSRPGPTSEAHRGGASW